MPEPDELETEVEVRVWDLEEGSRSIASSDEYNITVRNETLAACFHFWTESPTPDQIWIRSESIDLEEIPDNVASAMQDYVDDSVISWPAEFDSRQGEIDREEATIGITQNVDDDEVRYLFRIWSRDYVDVFRAGERIGEDAVPSEVLNTAEKYLPSSVQFFPAP